MSSLRRAAVLAGVLATFAGTHAAAPPAARADDWSLTRPAAPPTPRPKAHAHARAAAPRVARDARDLLIARYRGILAKDPFHAFAFDRLAALYRERDGNLDVLGSELDADLARTGERFALVVLRGRVAQARLDAEAAAVAFARAAVLDPRAAGPQLALADLARARNDMAGARSALEASLARATAPWVRGEVLRRLAELALDTGGFDDAERRYAELARVQGESRFTLTAYARALSERGEHARAAAAYTRALEQLRGDARAAGPVLTELARAQLATRDAAAALVTLARARRGVVAGTGAANEIDELFIQAHRAQGTLAEFAAERAAHASGPDADLLLARVHDELGDHAAALAALRSVLARRPRAVDARVSVIRLLTRAGRLDEASEEYRALVRAAPREPRFAIEWAELLMQTGKRAEALAALAAIGRQNPREERIHRALAELYSRWGENTLATAEVEILARLEPREAMHWVTLGEQYLVDGDRERALAAWRRIVEADANSARAHATLGEVLLDHDMASEAATEFERAVALEADSVEAVRGLADALERLNRRKEAADAWQRVLTLAHGDRVLSREARRRVVRLWMQLGELQPRLAAYERAFGWSMAAGAPQAGTPPDLDAGRFLAEAYQVVGRGLRGTRVDARYAAAAEAVLDRILRFEAGDVESLLALQRLRETRGDVVGAFAVLERLVEADPRNARGYLAQLADHALALYRDDDALRYAERAVALAPQDAGAQVRLGDLYRARQDSARATASYQRALELDPSLHRIHFALAELCLAAGEGDEAQAHLRQVVRSAPDDEVVKRAAHWAIQLVEGSNGLQALEQDLLPLALGTPGRPLHRRLLMALYDVMTRGWIHASSGSGASAAAAREALTALGRRAIKPLLEALVDSDPAQRRIAVNLLGHSGDAHAALPLLVLAEGDGEIGLRRDALVAVGRLRSEVLAPRLAALAEAPEQRLRSAGAWALAQLHGEPARAAMRALGASSDPVVRGHALLGLARGVDGSALPLARRLLRGDAHPWVRAAAAVALGWGGDRDDIEVLAESTRVDAPEVAALAALAMGAPRTPDAVPALADAAFSSQAVLRDAALRGLAWIGSRETPSNLRDIPEPDAGTPLTALVAAYLPPLPNDAIESVALHASELERAVRSALAGSDATAEVTLGWLDGGVAAPWPESAATHALRRRLATAAAAEITALVRHRTAGIRVAAVHLLGTLRIAGSASTLAGALGDTDPAVRSASLDALAGGVEAPAAVERLAAIAKEDARWSMRLRAVRALARIGSARAVSALVGALRSDPYAYVREAAAAALGRIGAGGGALRSAAEADPEPRVRRGATQALRSMARREGAGGAPPPAAGSGN